MQHERTECIGADKEHSSPGWWFVLYDDDGSKLWSDGPYETEALANWMQRPDVDPRTGEQINLRKTVKKIERTLYDIDDTLDVIIAEIKELNNNKEIIRAIESAARTITKTVIWGLCYPIFCCLVVILLAIRFPH